MSGNWIRTGKTRVCLVPRRWRTPLVGLQVEYENSSYYNDRPKMWERAGLSVLTEIKGLDPRKAPSTIRYRAHKRGLIFREYWLVMQVCDDPDAGLWRDAQVEDLGDIGGIKA